MRRSVPAFSIRHGPVLPFCLVLLPLPLGSPIFPIVFFIIPQQEKKFKKKKGTAHQAEKGIGKRPLESSKGLSLLYVFVFLFLCLWKILFSQMPKIFVQKLAHWFFFRFPAHNVHLFSSASIPLLRQRFFKLWKRSVKTEPCLNLYESGLFISVREPWAHGPETAVFPDSPLDSPAFLSINLRFALIVRSRSAAAFLSFAGFSKTELSFLPCRFHPDISLVSTARRPAGACAKPSGYFRLCEAALKIF